MLEERLLPLKLLIHFLRKLQQTLNLLLLTDPIGLVLEPLNPLFGQFLTQGNLGEVYPGQATYNHIIQRYRLD